MDQALHYKSPVALHIRSSYTRQLSAYACASSVYQDLLIAHFLKSSYSVRVLGRCSVRVNLCRIMDYLHTFSIDSMEKPVIDSVEDLHRVQAMERGGLGYAALEDSGPVDLRAMLEECLKHVDPETPECRKRCQCTSNSEQLQREMIHRLLVRLENISRLRDLECDCR